MYFGSTYFESKHKLYIPAEYYREHFALPRTNILLLLGTAGHRSAHIAKRNSHSTGFLATITKCQHMERCAHARWRSWHDIVMFGPVLPYQLQYCKIYCCMFAQHNTNQCLPWLLQAELRRFCMKSTTPEGEVTSNDARVAPSENSSYVSTCDRGTRPVPSDTTHWIGTSLPHSRRDSCNAIHSGLLPRTPPSWAQDEKSERTQQTHMPLLEFQSANNQPVTHCHVIVHSLCRMT